MNDLENIKESLIEIKEKAGEAQDRHLRGMDVLSLLSEIYREATGSLERIREIENEEASRNI